jgi:hypothetical protein
MHPRAPGVCLQERRVEAGPPLRYRSTVRHEGRQLLLPHSRSWLQLLEHSFQLTLVYGWPVRENEPGLVHSRSFTDHIHSPKGPCSLALRKPSGSGVFFLS